MNPLRRIVLVGCALAIVGLAVACGGETSDDASSGIPPGQSGPSEVEQINGTDLDVGEGGTLSSDGAAPSSAGTAVSGSGGGGTLQSVIGRKQIFIATLDIETDDVSRRFEDVGNIAALHGGFVASSTFGNRGETPTASLTIRVPADNYQRAIVDLRKLGDVKGVDQGGSDVTEEFTDLESRLRGLRAVEAQYLEFLSRSATIDEVLNVQDRINGVRVEIEQVQGRINLLSNQADLATITIHLARPVVGIDQVDGTTTPPEALVNGWEASLAVLTGAATVVLAVLAFSWWLVPIWIVVGYFVRRQMRTERSRRAQTLQPPATS